jgi:tetratricopeptide (TPR) repeat protein
VAEEQLDNSDSNRKKAQPFFEKGKVVFDTGNYEYGIEMYIQGLRFDPENIEAHQYLRDMSLRRKASGGKDLGMMEKMKLRKTGKDHKENMLNAEKMMSYDPGNTDTIKQMVESAYKATFYKTTLWVGPILLRANIDTPKSDFNKFIFLKDTYKLLEEWKLATEACNYAVRMRPEDMDLLKELKDLGAQETMKKGKYESGGSFVESVKNMDAQTKLMEDDKDIRSDEQLLRSVREAEGEWSGDPNDRGKLMKLVHALARTEHMEHENRGIELLMDAFAKTKQFAYRQEIGRIKIKQMNRMERSLREELKAKPTDESLKRQYIHLVRDQLKEELAEYTLWSENYPTEMSYRYEMAVRMFKLEQYSDVIPVLQQVRMDPKFRVEAAVYLGRAFLQTGFTDEAVDTLKGVIDEYPLRGDKKSLEMHYYYGRALEEHKDIPAAIKAYSQVAMWDFNHKDVQSRIKKLRGQVQDEKDQRKE